MGISADRAYKLQEKLTARIKDLMSQARHFHYTNEDISANMLAHVRLSHEWRKAPRYVHTYCDGVYRTLRDDIYRNHLVWMLSLDGVLRSSKEVDALTLTEKGMYTSSGDGWSLVLNKEYKSPWSRIDNDLSRHVWRSVAGTVLLDKPFDARFLACKLT